MNEILRVVDRATCGNVYLIGGTIRRVLVGGAGGGDLDFIVPNGDRRVFDALARLGLPHDLNRSRHHRYQWDGVQIEIFQPAEFYCGFRDVSSTLRYFDLRVNALALHLGSGSILDPFGIASKEEIPSDPGVNWSRWSRMSPMEISVLAIRLLRILRESSDLRVTRRDADRLVREVIPILARFSWDAVRDRHPEGKEHFVEHFQSIVEERLHQ